MNTVGNRNKDLDEKHTAGERILTGILRALLPPVSDNEQAAEYLRTSVGKDHPQIEWTAVRPDSLFDDESVTDYSIHPSPIRSALFNPGKTSRINVGHFMKELIVRDDLWQQWKGQMPVIYNSGLSG